MSMAVHQHDPGEVFANLGHLSVAKRSQAARKLIAQLDAAVDAKHHRGAVNIERAEMLLDLLQAPCPHCSKALGTHLGVDVPGLKASSGPKRRTTPTRVVLAAETFGAPAVVASAVVPATARPGAPGAGPVGGLTAKNHPTPHPGSLLHNLWHLLWG